MIPSEKPALALPLEVFHFGSRVNLVDRQGHIQGIVAHQAG